VHEFFAIVTHPRVYDPPSPIAVALEQVDAWIESPSLLLVGEGTEHWTTLRPLVEAGRVAGPKIHDARIAALCVSHGVQALWTADRDFSRFPALRAVNPLTSTEE
jgi:predicted nucleic acid-binding protein